MKYFPWILSGALIVIILLLLFRPKPDTAKELEQANARIERVEREKADVIQQKQVSDAMVDSIAQRSKARDSALAQAKQERAAIAVDLNRSIKRIADLKAQISTGRQNKDTAALATNCDSLADLTTELVRVIEDERRSGDAIVKIYDEQLLAKDSIIEEREKLYSGLRTSFDLVSAEYKAQHEAYKKEINKSKNAKTLNKILIGAVVVLGGIVIAK